VVGHDWGGVIAWRLAARHPARVHRLAIINAPHPGTYLRSLATSTQPLRSWYVAFFQLPWLPEFVLCARDHALLARQLRRGPAREGAFSEAEIERHRVTWRRPGAMKAGVDYYRMLFRRVAAETQHARHSARVTAPTLVLWGQRDKYLHHSLCTGLERWVPDVRVVRLPDASHWVLEDEPERVSAELAAFFAEG
jgi:pimeloyl-ACP methyl ester carboxylesterase